MFPKTSDIKVGTENMTKELKSFKSDFTRTT